MQENQEISVNELLYVVLKGWRLILTIIVILCVLSGSLAILNNTKISYSEDEIMARQKTMVTNNTEIKNLTASIDSNQKMLDSNQNYLNQSILLQINPNAQGVSESTVKVNLITGNQISSQQQQLIVSAIMANYLQSKNSDDFYKFINKYLNSAYTKEALNEVMYFNSDEAGILSIKVIFMEEKGASKIAYAVIEYFRSYSRTNMQMVQPHSLELVTMSETVVKNPALTNLRKSQEDAIAKLKANIEADKAQIRSLVIVALDSSKRKSVPQNVAVGIVLGIVFSAGYLLLRFYMNNRLRDEESAHNLLGLYVIGTVRRDS